MFLQRIENSQVNGGEVITNIKKERYNVYSNVLTETTSEGSGVYCLTWIYENTSGKWPSLAATYITLKKDSITGC